MKPHEIEGAGGIIGIWRRSIEGFELMLRDERVLVIIVPNWVIKGVYNYLSS